MTSFTRCLPPQSYIEGGLFKVTYGSHDSLVDFLHADNFCQAHVKAAEAMAEDQSPVVRKTLSYTLLYIISR